MPKRKKDSDKYILKKIRKLEKKIRRRRIRSSSMSSASPPPEEIDNPMVIRYSPSPPPDAQQDTLQQDDNEQDKENILDEDILQVLGSNNTKNTEEMGQKIHDQVAVRWENIIKNGLEKNEKDHILRQTYILPPLNCPHLVVPKLNPETLAACTEANKKRDSSIEARQKMISHAIAGLASATEKVLMEVQPKQLKISLLDILNNTGKVLADVFYNENKTRRSLIISGLERDVRDALLQTEPDKLLFGDNLFEKIKTAKSVGKTGREMRLQYKPPPKNTPRGMQPLNWRGPPRQTRKPLNAESRVNKNRSSGPRPMTSAKRATATSSRGYRKSNYSNQRHHRN